MPAPAHAAVSGPRTRPSSAAAAGASSVRYAGVSTSANAGHSAVMGRERQMRKSVTANARYAAPTLSETLKKGNASDPSRKARPASGTTAHTAALRATSGSVQLCG